MEPDWIKVLPLERQEYFKQIVRYKSIDGGPEYEYRQYDLVNPQIELLMHIVSLLAKKE